MPPKCVRSSAAWALGNVGPEAKEAVPALIEALKKDNQKRNLSISKDKKRIKDAHTEMAQLVEWRQDHVQKTAIANLDKEIEVRKEELVKIKTELERVQTDLAEKIAIPELEEVE